MILTQTVCRLGLPRHVWGVERSTALIFVMPEDTPGIAMARTARFGTRDLDWAADSPVYYTIPFAATPDQMRVRAGRDTTARHDAAASSTGPLTAMRRWRRTTTATAPQPESSLPTTTTSPWSWIAGLGMMQLWSAR